MKSVVVLFDYGSEGKITAQIPDEELYEVYAKDKVDGEPCTGVFPDEGGGPRGGSC